MLWTWAVEQRVGLVNNRKSSMQQQQQQPSRLPLPSGVNCAKLTSFFFQPAPLTPSQQQHQQQVRQHQQLLLQQQQQQQQETAAAQLAEVQQQAVNYFWELLEDFVALEAAPKSCFPQVPPSHPFSCVSGDSTLTVHRVVTEPAVD
jgi:hypothetical protein